MIFNKTNRSKYQQSYQQSLSTWRQVAPVLDAAQLLAHDAPPPNWQAFNHHGDESIYARLLSGLGAWLAAPFIMAIIGFMFSITWEHYNFFHNIVSFLVVGVISILLGVVLERYAKGSVFVEQFALIACMVGLGFLSYNFIVNNYLDNIKNINNINNINSNFDLLFLLYPSFLTFIIILIALLFSRAQVIQKMLALGLVFVLYKILIVINSYINLYLNINLIILFFILIALTYYQSRLACMGWLGQQQALLLACSIGILSININSINSSINSSMITIIVDLVEILMVAIIGKYAGSTVIPVFSLLAACFNIYILYFSKDTSLIEKAIALGGTGIILLGLSLMFNKINNRLNNNI